VKTTLELPDALFRRVKATAAERGQSLKEFVTEALQLQLARTTTRAAGEPPWMAQVLPTMDVLTVGEETAMLCAELCLQLRRSGRPIPTNDIWISALARQHGMPVLSRDAHFDSVALVDHVTW
jgi:predicted nucleic acid-binding protein